MAMDFERFQPILKMYMYFISIYICFICKRKGHYDITFNVVQMSPAVHLKAAVLHACSVKIVTALFLFQTAVFFKKKKFFFIPDCDAHLPKFFYFFFIFYGCDE